MPVEYLTFCDVSEIPPGGSEVFDLDAVSIVIFNVSGSFYAIENRCSHEEVELAEGEVKDRVIECPKHGARFSLETGAVLSAPAYLPVRTFPVRVLGTELQVCVNPSE